MNTAPHALLVIDVQRGAFDGRRCPPMPAGERLLACVCRLLAAARAAAVPVLFVRHGDDPGAPFEAGTAGHRLHEALEAQPCEPVIDKRACDAFADTTLGGVLAGLHAQRLLLCGLQSEWCVRATTLAALTRGFAVALAEDAHDTWPGEGRTAEAISAAVNAELAAAGAELKPTAAWAEELAARVRFGITRVAGERFVARDLQRHEVPQLQRQWDSNPLYFQTVNGRDARPDEALEEFDERPPANLSWGEHWMLGLFRSGGPRHGELVGTIVVVSDLVATGAWHLTLFWLATAEHGSGLAQGGYEALEAWVARQGARWFRLACVVGNTRAERFWARQGYVELKRWHDFDTGGRRNTLRVMLKPLGSETVAAYLDAVPRDRPAPA